MKENVSKVMDILKSYRSKKRMIEQLKYELANPARISASELLRSMSIGSSESIPVHGGSISDKTMTVAANYENVAKRLNAESTMQIERELKSLTAETSKLEFYVELLSKDHSDVIRLRDLEGKQWGEIELELNTTERRLRDRRKAAIGELAQMYGFVEALTDKKTQTGNDMT